MAKKQKYADVDIAAFAAEMKDITKGAEANLLAIERAVDDHNRAVKAQRRAEKAQRRKVRDQISLVNSMGDVAEFTSAVADRAKAGQMEW